MVRLFNAKVLRPVLFATMQMTVTAFAAGPTPCLPIDPACSAIACQPGDINCQVLQAKAKAEQVKDQAANCDPAKDDTCTILKAAAAPAPALSEFVSPVNLIGCDPAAPAFSVPAGWSGTGQAGAQTQFYGDIKGLSCRWLYGRDQLSDFMAETVKSVQLHYTIQWRENFLGKRFDYLTQPTTPIAASTNGSKAICFKDLGNQPETLGNVLGVKLTDSSKLSTFKTDGFQDEATLNAFFKNTTWDHSKHVHQKHFPWASGPDKNGAQRMPAGNPNTSCGKYCAFQFSGDLEDDDAPLEFVASPESCQLEQSWYRGLYLQAQLYWENTVLNNRSTDPLTGAAPMQLTDLSTNSAQPIQPCAADAADLVKASRTINTAMKLYYEKFAKPTIGKEAEYVKAGLDPKEWQKALDFCSFHVRCMETKNSVTSVRGDNANLKLCKDGLTNKWDKGNLTTPPPGIPTAAIGVCSVVLNQELMQPLWAKLLSCEIDAKTQRDFTGFDMSQIYGAAFDVTSASANAAQQLQAAASNGNIGGAIQASQNYVNSMAGKLTRSCVAKNYNEKDIGLGQDQSAYVDGGQWIDRKYGYNWKHNTNATINYNWAYQENVNGIFDYLYSIRSPASIPKNAIFDRIQKFDQSTDYVDFRNQLDNPTPPAGAGGANNGGGN